MMGAGTGDAAPGLGVVASRRSSESDWKDDDGLSPMPIVPPWVGYTGIMITRPNYKRREDDSRGGTL